MRKFFLLGILGAVLAIGGVWLFLLMQPAPGTPASAGSTPSNVEKTPAVPPVPTLRPSAEVATSPAVKKGTANPKALATESPAAPVAEVAPTSATLRIAADVADASVFIDRKFVGTAPVVAAEIAPGPHHLNVSAPGYDAVSIDIDVAVGERDITIKLKDVRLAATVQVKHKHAMGSCAGTLRASPQGITFETANKDDAFSVALGNIDVFEVDYLAKNLKLKVKGGRTYNFTDPDGNADRLFVFHRDVEKARTAR